MPKDYHYLEFSKALYKKFYQGVSPSSVDAVLIDPAEVNEKFRLAVSDIAYRLSRYRKILDIEERKIEELPYEIRRRAEKQVLEEYGQVVSRDMTEATALMDSLCERQGLDDHFRCKTYLQEHLYDLSMMASALTARAYHKPSGYAGDAEMMRMLCSLDLFVGKNFHEKCVYFWSKTTPSGALVRTRLKLIQTSLVGAVQETLRKKDRVRILDLACGPALPLQEILKMPEADHLDIYFIDQDAQAMEWLQRRMRDLSEIYRRKTNFSYDSRPIQEILSDTKALPELAGQDFILSSGLFDYLNDDYAQMLIQALYSLLGENGALLVGNISPKLPTKIYQWYGNEWPLNYRTAEDLLGFVPKGIQGGVESEELGLNLFLKIRK